MRDRRWRFAAPATRWVRENLTLGLLAVGLAVALWVYVTEEENPRVTVDVTPAVRVRAVNVPEGAAVLGLGAPVAIRASAPEDVAEGLVGEDFDATVDLEGLSLGSFDVPVQVNHVGDGHGVQVVQVVPGRVNVTLQPLREVELPVRAEIGLRPPIGYDIASDPEVTPDTVTVSGPEDLIERVVEVTARIDLANATADVRANVPLVASNGTSAIEGVTIEPDTASVTVAIQQTRFERAFAVNPRITGNPAPGYSVASVEVEPPTVVLSGPLDALDEVSAAQTNEIDLSGAISDIVQQVQLELPDEVRVRGGPDTVQVRVRIIPQTGRARFAVPPTLQGVGDGLAARSLDPFVQIDVEGPLPQLQGLGPASFVAIADVSGEGEGQHEVDVSVRAPAGLRVISVDPESVRVEVTRP
ncbi:MAG TPA: CdaR family protein [Dehalococcoidia bacterium]|nr:CdaR family protein [Dehalococcoidia bacterium]